MLAHRVYTQCCMLSCHNLCGGMGCKEASLLKPIRNRHCLHARLNFLVETMEWFLRLTRLRVSVVMNFCLGLYKRLGKLSSSTSTILEVVEATDVD